MTTGTLAKLGVRGIRGKFFKRLEEAEMASWLRLIASIDTSDQEIETYEFTSDSPTLKERGNNPTKKGLKTFELTLRNKTYQNILEIPDDWFRRDKTAQILRRVNERAARAAQLPQSVMTALLKANGKAYDKKNFFATNHVNENGDTIDNDREFTRASATDFTMQEAVDAVLRSTDAIVEFLDDEGEPRNEFAREFTVMCPIRLRAPMLAAVRNDFTVNGASNTLKNADYQIRVVANPRLTADDEFFTFRSDSDVQALQWQDEVATQFSERNPMNSDKGFEDDVHLFKVKRVCAGGYARFDQAVRTRLVTS